MDGRWYYEVTATAAVAAGRRFQMRPARKDRIKTRQAAEAIAAIAERPFVLFGAVMDHIKVGNCGNWCYPYSLMGSVANAGSRRVWR